MASRRRFSILLIIMMIITPVASAIGHCNVVDMPEHMSINLNSSGSDDAASSLPDQASFNCHIGGDCTLHSCSGLGITLTSTMNDFVELQGFLNVVILSPYNTTYSPEIRPPIHIL